MQESLICRKQKEVHYLRETKGNQNFDSHG